MKISQKGVLEIAEHEGIVLGPYVDDVGVWTIYAGHTKAAGGLDPSKMQKVDTRGWSDARVMEELITAAQVFDADLDSYEARVNRAIAKPLKQHQFDALVSFDFNTGGIFAAKLTQQIKAGDMSGAGFMGWLKPKSITKRRTAEMNLFRTGNYDANGDSIPVYDARGDGGYKFRRSMSGAELARLMSSGTHSPPTASTGGLAAIFAAIIKALTAFFGGKS